MPDKLTDTEVKKALECCKNDGIICYECPYKKTNGCMEKLSADALDLINRYEEEKTELLGKIEQLEKDKVLLSSEISRLNSVNQMNENHIQKLKAEIDKLKLEMSYMSSSNTIGDKHEMGCW